MDAQCAVLSSTAGRNSAPLCAVGCFLGPSLLLVPQPGRCCKVDFQGPMQVSQRVRVAATNWQRQLHLRHLGGFVNAGWQWRLQTC